MTALAFHQHNLYIGQSPAALRKILNHPQLLLETPSDLNIAAFEYGKPNCTIFALVEKLLSSDIASKYAGRCSNNAVCWFDALSKSAKILKKDFTSEQTGVTLEKPSRSKIMDEAAVVPELNEIKKNKKTRLNKNLRIKKLVQDNPRRSGTHGFKSWQVIIDGMDIAAYLENGGRMNDLLWEIKHKHIEVA